ncbi:MAG: protein kinase [Myxococcales bacterium]|nr:protein kinase [Myxococcota bacterium]MDW8284034.1 protein kinase [Myxococcales bacterium]
MNPRFGKYELLAHLATGGMAEIYLARVAGAEGFSKLVVVKRLLDKLAKDPEFVQMFLDEARINARLSHSNIVQVLELGEVDGQYFMAMEYVSGLSVAQVGRLATQRLGEVPQGVACGIVAQSCAGLHRAHETKLPDGSNMGIIHRDVSPQNLLLTYEGYVKVVDFGIAKAEGRATQTRAGLVKGKFAYMSPEQCLGEEIDRRTDIFALGIVLFELCTSRRLFKRKSTYETYDAIVRCEIPPPSSVNKNVPPAVEAVIMKALARRPEDRFPTAEAMQEALELSMRRSGLRGSPLDLSRFLEQHFAQEIREHEQLIRRVEAGELAQPEHQAEVEKSYIARAFKEQEAPESPEDPVATVIQDRPAPGPIAAPPPSPASPATPVVRVPPPLLAQDQLEVIPHRPMSMSMPIVGKEGPPPAAVPMAGTAGGPGSVTVVPPAAEPAGKSAATSQPLPPIVPPPAAQSGPLPPVASMDVQAPAASSIAGLATVPLGPRTGSVQAPGGEAAPLSAPPPGWLYRLANLPMPYLVAIAVLLAALAALITALTL